MFILHVTQVCWQNEMSLNFSDPQVYKLSLFITTYGGMYRYFSVPYIRSVIEEFGVSGSSADLPMHCSPIDGVPSELLQRMQHGV